MIYSQLILLVYDIKGTTKLLIHHNIHFSSLYAVQFFIQITITESLRIYICH